jgi:hypothetical protein
LIKSKPTFIRRTVDTPLTISSPKFRGWVGGSYRNSRSVSGVYDMRDSMDGMYDDN